MAKIGYRRVSSEGQNLDRQALDGCDKIFEDKASAATKERPALNDLIAWVREGDDVVVWSIDRLARSLVDLQSIIETLNRKGVSVSFLSEKLKFTSDSSDPCAYLQLQIMGAMAQFERNLILKRQREGIEAAKAKGVYKGRKKSIDEGKILEMRGRGIRVSQIAAQLQISRASVYRLIGNLTAED